MTRPLPIPPPGFDDLPVDEKVEYVEALWDRIAAEPKEISVPAWHLEVVSDRLAEYRRNPGDGRRWQQVRDELLRELASRKRSNSP